MLIVYVIFNVSCKSIEFNLIRFRVGQKKTGIGLGEALGAGRALSKQRTRAEAVKT